MADTQRVIEIEVFSCIRQAIVRFLFDFETRTGLPATHSVVIGACEAHFNFWGPVPNQSLRILITQIAGDVVASHWVSPLVVLSSCHSTPILIVSVDRNAG